MIKIKMQKHEHEHEHINIKIFENTYWRTRPNSGDTWEHVAHGVAMHYELRLMRDQSWS
jgi:hypothetical protein